MTIDRELARHFLGDMTASQQLNQILIERMHPLPHTSFNNAIQKLKFIFGNRFLRAAIDTKNFDARQAVPVDRWDQPLRNHRFEIAREKLADVFLLAAWIIHPQAADRLRC